MRRRSLVALSHGFEEAFAGTEVTGNDASVLIGLFQRAENFEAEASRYRRLATRAAVVVAHSGTASEVEGVHSVSLDSTDPLASEWTLVGFGPDCGAALVATERTDTLSNAPDRVFEARWTFRQSVAAVEGERLLAQLGDHLPAEVAQKIQRAVDSRRDRPDSEAERAQARIMETLLASVDELDRRTDGVGEGSTEQA